MHMSLWNMMELPTLSSWLIEIRVKAISGAQMASLRMALVCFGPFGNSMQISPIPTALKVQPSAVVIFHPLIGW